MNDNNKSYSDDDYKNLERLLLLEKIEAYKRTNKRGWFWHMGPTIGAILASVAASIIIILGSSQFVRGVVTEVAVYYQSIVKVAQNEVKELEKRIAKLTESEDSIKRELKTLTEEKSVLLNKISAIANYKEKLNPDDSIGISVEIKVKSRSYYLIVHTYPSNAKILAFDLVDNNFVFPGQVPDIKTAKIILNVSKLKENSDTKSAYSPCIVGPIGVGPSDYVWIQAEKDGMKSLKCVHLTLTNL